MLLLMVVGGVGKEQMCCKFNAKPSVSLKRRKTTMLISISLYPVKNEKVLVCSYVIVIGIFIEHSISIKTVSIHFTSN